jgi:hypothetical protein
VITPVFLFAAAVSTGVGHGRYLFCNFGRWQDYDVKVVINSDAHHPEHMGVGTDKCYEMARQLNLEIVDFSFLEGT